MDLTQKAHMPLPFPLTPITRMRQHKDIGMAFFAFVISVWTGRQDGNA